MARLRRARTLLLALGLVLMLPAGGAPAAEPLAGLDWFTHFGAAGEDTARAVAVDASGNVLVAGGFSGTVTMPPGIDALVSKGQIDAFVVKYAPDGSMLWARSVGGSEIEGITSIAVDDDGDVIVAGVFNGTADFDPDPSATYLLTATTTTGNGFAFSLDPSGDFRWAGRIGGNETVYVQAVGTDSARDVYLGGLFTGTADFDPGTGSFPLTSAGLLDSFVVKLDVSGGFQWARRVGGTGMDALRDTAVTSGGDVVSTGYFSGTTDFDHDVSGQALLTSMGPTHDGFVWILDRYGVFVWAGQIGSPTGDAEGVSVDLDAGGRIFVAGDFSGDVDFDPGTATQSFAAGGGQDAFVLALDSGGGFRWVATVATPTQTEPTDLAVDGWGNTVAALVFEGTAYFPDGETISARAQEDTAVWRLDPDGGLQWIRHFAGTGEEQALAAAPGLAGDVFVVGDFTGTLDFDPGPPTLDETAQGNEDAFVVRLADTCGGLPVTIAGTAWNDDLRGTSGNDVIRGYGGDDTIIGNGGDDRICGDAGNDDLRGGRGADSIWGDTGNDRLRGAAGDDWLYGGDGSDRLIPETGNDHLDGGPGSDIVDYLAADGPVEVDLPAGGSYYWPGTDTWFHTLTLIEKADGTRFDDVLIGDWKRNVLRGKQGDDRLDGRLGDDDLIGGMGEDRIFGNQGADLLKGQAGDDWMYGQEDADRLVGGSGDDHLFGGPGDDVLIGGLKIHFGTYTNEIDGEAGTDTCRWWFDAPANCEP